MEIASFAAGCFWGVQAEFDKIPGVVETTVGYMGGKIKNPTYKQVCTDTTGHAEAIEIKYDPEKISYEKLLEIFWSIHDPTQYNRQGVDVGSQYRSVIFYHNDEQRRIAEESKIQQQSKFDKKIVTEIVQAPAFYPAEDYHQKYLEKKDKAGNQIKIIYFLVKCKAAELIQ